MGNVFTRIVSKMKLAKGIDRMNGHRLYLGLPLYELGFDVINTEETNDMFYDECPEDIDEPFDAKDNEDFDAEDFEDNEDFEDDFDSHDSEDVDTDWLDDEPYDGN